MPSAAARHGGYCARPSSTKTSWTSSRPAFPSGTSAGLSSRVLWASVDLSWTTVWHGSRMTLNAVEIRVLGCLVEKQRTTPEQYPLSLNALRLAANQTTSRDPVTHYDEATIRRAMETLGDRGWTRLASGPGSRTAKFRHLLDEALQLTPPQLALLAVLMLRGPQTAA